MEEIFVDENGYNQFLEELEKLKQQSLLVSSTGSKAYQDAIGDGWHDNFAFYSIDFFITNIYIITNAFSFLVFVSYLPRQNYYPFFKPSNFIYFFKVLHYNKHKLFSYKNQRFFLNNCAKDIHFTLV